MNAENTPEMDRLLFLLHRGLVELRLIALSQGNPQAADLADALEDVPRLIRDRQEGDFAALRSDLKRYGERYQSRFDYLGTLEQNAPEW